MAPFPVRWTPGDFVYREPAEASLRDVARKLGLSTTLRSVRVRVIQHAAGDHARVAWIEAPRLARCRATSRCALPAPRSCTSCRT